MRPLVVARDDGAALVDQLGDSDGRRVALGVGSGSRVARSLQPDIGILAQAGDVHLAAAFAAYNLALRRFADEQEQAVAVAEVVVFAVPPGGPDLGVIERHFVCAFYSDAVGFH